jgi:hypothetical protein
MSLRFRVLLLSILIIPASAFAQINIVNFDFGAVPVQCSSWGFTYQGAQLTCNYPVTQNFDASPGFGWMMGSTIATAGSPSNTGAGVAAPDAFICPPSFSGMPFHQAALLQNVGSFLWQAVAGFNPGSYTLSFYLGSRCPSGWWDGEQIVTAQIDGVVIGTWNLTNSAPFTLQTANFSVSTGGTHTVAFVGMRPGDHTAFLSYVTITPTAR